jgi:hypothetical protein
MTHAHEKIESRDREHHGNKDADEYPHRAIEFPLTSDCLLLTGDGLLLASHHHFLIVHLEFLKLDELREQGVRAIGHGGKLGGVLEYQAANEAFSEMRGS